MKHLILILVIIPTLLFSQGWEKTYDFNEIDFGNSVQQTTDGGYIITGHAGYFGPVLPGGNVLLLKTNSNGDTLWTQQYGGYSLGIGNSVQQCNDGGYIIAGRARSFGNAEDVYLIRTDENGDTLWTQTYGGASGDYGNSVQQCTDGGYIVAGYTESFGNGNADVYLIKTDENGDTLWTTTYGDANDDLGNSVQQCTVGGYIIAGSTRSFGNGYYDVYLIKTDENGDTLWTKTYGGQYLDRGFSVQQCTDGGYIVAGITESFGNGETDVYLIKTDANGDTLWTTAFGGTSWDYGFSVQQCIDGGFIVAGSTQSFGNGSSDVYLIKTDSNGETVWTATYGDTNDDAGYSVLQCTDGGYIIAGHTGGDVYLIKTDENGNITFTFEIPAPNPNRKLIKTIDLFGREMSKPIMNQPYIEIYDDATTQKKIKIE